ncbi:MULTISPECIES: right-handed parallel beta-helix repeat-containing protein [Mumia]|uniref:right-handed parallel beta-helix repeat-containing protein n=1 Tax=Mumia TaxID=1546255 RepID=UPI001422A7B2|nr:MULTISPECIES: right-handed parallel beta-helix repeat-containing protein [unclassified Mumia]QMW67122.1 right-handed parallel beta-helix repeat-containing protein [Mumia sp. ZJ1417]
MLAAAAGRTYYVSTRGNDGASGTIGAPMRTIGAAVSRAGSGDTIAIRRGTYHESVKVPDAKRLTIRAHAGEAVVLDGSRRVTGWSRSGRHAVARWTTRFDASPTYSWGVPDNRAEGWQFVNRRFPMAAHPDQVWVGGRRLRQVGSVASLRAGTFFVDYTRGLLYLGSPPGGREVRASALAKALSLRAPGTVVSGIDVRRYAPSVPHMGAVTITGARTRLTDVSIDQNATTGLHVAARNVVLDRVRTRANGMIGASATYADGLHISRMTSKSNNTEHFNTAPVAGGMKIGRARNIVVRRSVFRGNRGTGLWLDESVEGAKVLDSRFVRNVRHGLSAEISANVLIAGNHVKNNRGHGVKVNNTGSVSIWNNTIVGNGRAVNVVQDARRPSSRTTAGRDPRRAFPDRRMTWRISRVTIRNNILAVNPRRGNCVLCVEDYTGRRTARQMGVTAKGNVYRRPGKRPAWLVVWSRGSRDPATFRTVAQFRRATAQERRHLLVRRKKVATRSGTATRFVARKARRIATPLPAGIAIATARARGLRVLGRWR